MLDLDKDIGVSNMWIISQDKRTILFTNKVIVSGKDLLAFSEMDYNLVGEYESEERAKEEVKKITHFLIKGGKVYEVD